MMNRRLIGLPFILLGILASSSVPAGGRPSGESEPPWEEGVIRIRIKTGARDSLVLSSAADGTGLLAIPSLDILNRRFRAVGIRPVFRTDPRHARRHRKWGLDRWFEIRLDSAPRLEEAIAAYRDDPHVEIAEPVYRKVLDWLPDDPRFGEQWHYRNTGQTGGTPGADIRLEEAWEIERGHPSVIVQVVDTGIDLNHPDLSPNLWINPVPGPENGYTGDYHGWNFADDNDDIQDVRGHGSHVAGTVAAVSNNNLGVAGVAGGSGTGDGVRIMVARTFGADADRGFAQAIVYGADNGAVISQNSWTYKQPGVYEEAVLNAIDYFIANAGGSGTPLNGGVVIFSAGNSESSAEYYPGAYPPVLAVAATNHQDRKAWYSNYGNWVDIAAPGGETVDRDNRLIAGGVAGVLSAVLSDRYSFLQGTSMAAPHVSGVAALIVSRSPGRDGAFVRSVLAGSADDIDPLNPDYPGLLGAGRLNAHRALTLTLAVTPGPGLFSSGEWGGPFTPASGTYTLKNVSGAELDWTAEVSEAWVEVAPAGGTLADGAGTEIGISLTPAADALPAGVYTDTLRVTDTTSGAEFRRGVRLAANPTLCEALDNCGLTWTTGGDGDWFGQMEESHDGVDAARSGPVGHDEVSWLETEAEGPGILYFWWKVSSEDDYDWLEFSVNGGLPDAISGDVDWREEAYELGAGTHTLRWSYTKDGSVSVGRDRGWVDRVRIDPLLVLPGDEFFARGDQGGPFSPGSRTYTLKNAGPAALEWTAEVSETWVESAPAGGTLAPGAETEVAVGFTAGAELLTPGTYSGTLRINNSSSGEVFERGLGLRVEVELCAALDNCGLTWTTGGAAGWFGQVEESHDGEDAARSGEISEGENSRLETEVEGPGLLTYYWKVSSAAHRDFLSFYLDGDRKRRISGERDWVKGIFEVGEGSRTLSWVYEKGPSGGSGRDCGWVDQVDFRFNPLLVPGGDFLSVGPEGGLFNPEGKTYRLKNLGEEPLYWLGQASPAWLEVSPEGGTLEPAGEVDVNVSLAPAAGNLPVGEHSGIIMFYNSTADIMVERAARLTVAEAPTPTPPPSATPAATATRTPTRTPTPSRTPAPPATATPTPNFIPPWICDYDGDGTSDPAVFRPASGLWAVRGLTRAYFGTAGDIPVPGDYTGDGTTEMAVFRGSSGLWAVRGGSRVYFGTLGDVPVPADYRGGGTADIGIYRPASGLWAVRGFTRVYFGRESDIPVPGYYGSEGKKSIGIFRPASGLWAIRGVTRAYFGSLQDEPVPGDYSGDGLWSPAIFRASSGLWAIRGVSRVYFGGSVDEPIPGGYRGDGKDYPGIFRPATGLWAIRGLTRAYFGASGDLPATR